MHQILARAAQLQADESNRAAQAMQHTARLCMAPPKPDAVQEGMALAQATMARASQMQKRWTQAWLGWADYAQSLQGADTVPKFFERSGNIVLQAHAQMMRQATDITELAENAGTSYAYWVSRQIDDD